MAVLGGGVIPPLGAAVPPVVEQVGQRVGAQHMAGLGGLAQPVFGAGLVTALAVVPAQRVRGGGRPGDRGDTPPAGRVVGVTALVQQQAQVVGGGAVPVLDGLAQIRLGAVEVAAAQQQGAERAHRERVAVLGGPPVPGLDLGLLAQRETVLVGQFGEQRGDGAGSRRRGKGVARPGRRQQRGHLAGDRSRRGHGGQRRVARRTMTTMVLTNVQQPRTIPHKPHRCTTRYRRTPGIPQPSWSLQRFVDFPTRGHVKRG